jgi:hypothetical protein
MIANQRGESEAQVLRSMITREAATTLEGKPDAELPPSKVKTDLAMALLKSWLKTAKQSVKRQPRRRRDPLRDFPAY